MRCPSCGDPEAGLTTAETSSPDPAARWATTCGCGYRWVHPYRDGWGSPMRD